MALGILVTHCSHCGRSGDCCHNIVLLEAKLSAGCLGRCCLRSRSGGLGIDELLVVRCGTII